MVIYYRSQRFLPSLYVKSASSYSQKKQSDSLWMIWLKYFSTRRRWWWRKIEATKKKHYVVRKQDKNIFFVVVVEFFALLILSFRFYLSKFITYWKCIWLDSFRFLKRQSVRSFFCKWILDEYFQVNYFLFEYKWISILLCFVIRSCSFCSQNDPYSSTFYCLALFYSFKFADWFTWIVTMLHDSLG